MNSEPSSHQNPFSDSATFTEEDTQAVLESTLPVGANASLTLDAHGIIVTGWHPAVHEKRRELTTVTDDGFDDEDRTLLCGLIASQLD